MKQIACTYNSCKGIAQWTCGDEYNHCKKHKEYNIDAGQVPSDEYKKLTSYIDELDDPVRQSKDGLADVLIDWHMLKEVRV